MPPITLRPYQPGDEAAIQEITYRTGFKGEDLTRQGYFDDSRLWFMIFISYYTPFDDLRFLTLAKKLAKLQR